jgi:uncharacterized membrane protein YkvA (DUF1232 family)
MSLKEKAKQLKNETYALYLASKDKRVPWYAKAFVIVIVGYALSPIDLIPDFIPVLGFLDDLILVPAGIYIALKMIPHDVMYECREKAKQELGKGKTNWVAAAIIIIIWAMILALVIWVVWKGSKGIS